MTKGQKVAIGFLGVFLLAAVLPKTDTKSNHAANATSPESITAPVFSSPAPPDAPSPSGDWQISESKSEMDDSDTVTLSLIAESPIAGWPNQITTPHLIIRCQEHRTALIVYTGIAPNPELGHFSTVTARIRLDDGPAQDNEVSESTDHKALFLPETVPFIKDLMLSHRMVFRFTPFSSPPAETTFALDGLAQAVKPVRKACHW
jgi:type VI secretion system protein VasI